LFSQFVVSLAVAAVTSLGKKKKNYEIALFGGQRFAIRFSILKIVT
jgi:hypothetical protein